LEDFSNFIAMAGTAAFAVTAVLAVTDRGIDLFGAVVLGIITAVGGGTVRDLILDVPVFWSADISFVWVALGASLIAFVAHSYLARRHIGSLFLYVDGLGAALFAVQATGKVWDLDFGLPVAPVMLGVVTAIGGGLIRDVLAGRPTLLMSRELYAVPVLFGCLVFVALLAYFPEQRIAGSIGCILLIFGLRAAAIHWDVKVPYWFTTKPTAQ
jgi:uncharacterized membrane protein YeiH